MLQEKAEDKALLYNNELYQQHYSGLWFAKALMDLDSVKEYYSG